MATPKTKTPKSGKRAALDGPALLSLAISVYRDPKTKRAVSAREFARSVLVRDSRTLFRWLKGASPIPEAVTTKCREIVAAAPIGRALAAQEATP